ncbi:MAG: hypothetical protein LAO19_00205 [Acidobacteriia bacterium]|nr:hypothetical protein [Terriglobia bacterium]
MELARDARRTILCCLLVLCTCAAKSAAQSRDAQEPDANPARPTVSTPATLTPVGYLQFETGGLTAENSPEFSGRISLQQVIKLTVHPRLQLLLQSEPVVWSRTNGQGAFQTGGVAAGAQVVLLPGADHRPTVSASYLRSAYSGPAPDIDIGSAVQSATILVSGDVLGFHFDANGIANEQQEGVLRRAQWGQTLSVSHPLKMVTISGEIWHFSQPLLRGNTVGNLWAVSYAARKNLVFDAAFNHGFNATSTRTVILFGFTYLLPHRLW